MSLAQQKSDQLCPSDSQIFFSFCGIPQIGLTRLTRLTSHLVFLSRLVRPRKRRLTRLTRERDKLIYLFFIYLNVELLHQCSMLLLVDRLRLAPTAVNDALDCCQHLFRHERPAFHVPRLGLCKRQMQVDLQTLVESIGLDILETLLFPLLVTAPRLVCRENVLAFDTDRLRPQQLWRRCCKQARRIWVPVIRRMSAGPRSGASPTVACASPTRCPSFRPRRLPPARVETRASAPRCIQ